MGRMEDLREARRPPEHTVNGLKLGQDYPRNTRENRLHNGAEESAKLQAVRRNRGNYEVLTDDKDYFKVIADARLKLEKDVAPAMPCIVREDIRGNL